MITVLFDFMSQLLDTIIRDLLEMIVSGFGNLLRSAYKIETLPGLDQTVLSTTTVQNILHVLYGFTVALLALKLIWKGWKVYVLWRDGESETPPGEMVTGAIYALIVAVSFPILYDGAVSIALEISSTVLQYSTWAGIGIYDTGSIISYAIDLINQVIAGGALYILLALVFLIVLIILAFKMLLKGVELLIWRLGIPIAVVGLVDSDGGAWKPYIQVLFKELATTMVQYFCMVTGILVAARGSLIGMVVGIVIGISGISAPKLMAQFMSPSGGGGMTQKVSTVVMVARAFAA